MYKQTQIADEVSMTSSGAFNEFGTEMAECYRDITGAVQQSPLSGGSKLKTNMKCRKQIMGALAHTYSPGIVGPHIYD